MVFIALFLCTYKKPNKTQGYYNGATLVRIITIYFRAYHRLSKINATLWARMNNESDKAYQRAAGLEYLLLLDVTPPGSKMLLTTSSKT